MRCDALRCVHIWRKEGAKVRLLNADHLKSTFKWINTEGVELGSFGYLNEGSLDPRKYLLAVRRAATYHGAHFVNGEVTSLDDQNIAKQPAWLNAPKTKDNINVASVYMHMSDVPIRRGIESTEKK